MYTLCFPSPTWTSCTVFPHLLHIRLPSYIPLSGPLHLLRCTPYLPSYCLGHVYIPSYRIPIQHNIVPTITWPMLWDFWAGFATNHCVLLMSCVDAVRHIWTINLNDPHVVLINHGLYMPHLIYPVNTWAWSRNTSPFHWCYSQESNQNRQLWSNIFHKNVMPNNDRRLFVTDTRSVNTATSQLT